MIKKSLSSVNLLSCLQLLPLSFSPSLTHTDTIYMFFPLVWWCLGNINILDKLHLPDSILNAVEHKKGTGWPWLLGYFWWLSQAMERVRSAGTLVVAVVGMRAGAPLHRLSQNLCRRPCLRTCRHSPKGMTAQDRLAWCQCNVTPFGFLQRHVRWMRWALWMLMVGRSCFQLEKSGHGAWQFCKMKVILTIYNDTYTNKKLWIHTF